MGSRRRNHLTKSQLRYPDQLHVIGTRRKISTDRRNFDVLPDGQFIGIALADGEGSGSAMRPREIRIALNWFEELKSRVPTR